MGKFEQVGGIGKNPGTEKLNRIKSLKSASSKAEAVKNSVFKEDEEVEQINNIVSTYNISYSIQK